MSIYYCIKCKEIHDDVELSDGLHFKTGFRLFPDGQNVPLGVCAREELGQLGSEAVKGG